MTVSIPSAARLSATIPCLRYADPEAAILWLVKVLGARSTATHRGPDGAIMHAELWFGSGCVMLGGLRPDEMPPTSAGQGAVYLVAENAAEVDALHERAVASGARIAITLRDTDYGSHDFGCLDPEGNLWAFGTYAPPSP